MNVAVFGAGAVGGLIAGKMAACGQQVSLIARGSTVARLNETGIFVTEGDRTYKGRPTVVDVSETGMPGPRDVVVLAVKAHHLAAALPAIAPLVGADTTIVPAINGIPWWYTSGAGQPGLEGRRLTSVDPAGMLAGAFPADQTVGCVVYVASVSPGPGMIESVGPRQLVVGGATAAAHKRADAVSRLFEAAEFRAPVEVDIRRAVWMKLMGNIHSNPLSVLTGASMSATCSDPYVRSTSRDMMVECAKVAGACGTTLDISIDERLDQGRRLGDFKTSMLQDFEKGRDIELDAILGVVLEIADWLGIDTPTMRTIYGLTRLRAQLAGCYSKPV